MSISTAETAELEVIRNGDLNFFDIVKQIATDRPYFIFGVPKILFESAGRVAEFVASHMFSQFVTVSNACAKTGLQFLNISGQLAKVVDTEDVIGFFQGVINTPKEVENFSEKLVAWWKGHEDGGAVLNQFRKLGGHTASTLGDYVNASRIARAFNVQLPELLSEKAGTIGSLLGAANRIYSYAIGDISKKHTFEFHPALSKIRDSLEDSKNSWDAIRDVSIVALNVCALALGGFAHVSSGVVTALSGSILGARLVARVKEMKLEKINQKYSQAILKQNTVKAS